MDSERYYELQLKLNPNHKAQPHSIIFWGKSSRYNDHLSRPAENASATEIQKPMKQQIVAIRPHLWRIEMNVIYDEKDRAYKVMKITGPRHNFLGLVFSDAPIKLKVINLEEDKSSCVNESQLIDAVLKGVQKENTNNNFQINLEKILYVGSDSPWYETYELLARDIVQWFIKKNTSQ